MEEDEASASVIMRGNRVTTNIEDKGEVTLITLRCLLPAKDPTGQPKVLQGQGLSMYCIYLCQ